MKIRKLADAEAGHEDRTLLFVSGYLTEACDYQPWVASFRRAGWPGKVYAMDWTCGGRYHTHLAGAFCGTAIATEAISWSLLMIPGLAPLVTLNRAVRWSWRAFRCATYVGTLTTGLRIHWRQHVREAVRAGKRLGEALIHEQPDWATGELRLAGHSLGTRVIYEALRTSAQHGTKIADHVDLYGGTVPAQCDNWSTALTAVRGSVRNFYSRNDEVLQYLFVPTERVAPIGLQPVEVKPMTEVKLDESADLAASRQDYPADTSAGESDDLTTILRRPTPVQNHDVTDLVLNHADYHAKLCRERFSLVVEQSALACS